MIYSLGLIYVFYVKFNRYVNQASKGNIYTLLRQYCSRGHVVLYSIHNLYFDLTCHKWKSYGHLELWLTTHAPRRFRVLLLDHLNLFEH